MKYKKDVSISTDDFWYDLTDGGYIKPEGILEDPSDVEKIKNAINVLARWKFEMEEKGIIEYN
jgi:hypothetical protein